VEVTAYNTLSLIMQDKLPEALQAIKWMTTNRNSQGGFVSTQDTMVAMQVKTRSYLPNLS
jgi:CD109 antigen